MSFESAIQSSAASFIATAEKQFFAHVSDHLPTNLIGGVLHSISENVRAMTSQHADFGVNFAGIAGGHEAMHVDAPAAGNRATGGRGHG